MKKLSILLLLFTMLFSSCQDEVEIYEENVPVKAIIPEEDKAIIEQLGLDLSTLVDKGDDYQLEGDIMLSKEHLREYLNEPEEGKTTKQGYISNTRLISIPKSRNITVRIDPAIPTSGSASRWRQAVIDAVNAWNSIGLTCLKFTYTTASSADITVTREYSSDNAIAWTWLPNYQKPSNKIVVNSRYDNYEYQANTLIHEMGHSIGLLHSHVTPATEGGIVVPGTPNIDDSSIMSYNRDRTLLPGFSKYDLFAIRYLYPSKLPYINVKEKSFSSGRYTLTLMNHNDFPGGIRWELENAKMTSYFSTSHDIEILRSGSGFMPNDIKVTVRKGERILCKIRIDGMAGTVKPYY